MFWQHSKIVIFGCESIPISRNVRMLVSQSANAKKTYKVPKLGLIGPNKPSKGPVRPSKAQ